MDFSVYSPKNINAEALTSSGTVFGEWAIKEVITVKGDHVGRALIP